MEHTINACGHANSTVHENMQSLIEQSGSVRKYAKDEIIYLQGDTAQSFATSKGQCKGVYEFRWRQRENSQHGKTRRDYRWGCFFDKSRESVPPRHLQIPKLLWLTKAIDRHYRTAPYACVWIAWNSCQQNKTFVITAWLNDLYAGRRPYCRALAWKRT